MSKEDIDKKINIGYKKIEVCNECGRNASKGSGLFVDRVIDFDDYKTRKEMNKPFPKGNYICRECETKIYILPKTLISSRSAS